MKIQVAIYGVVAPCRDMVAYQLFHLYPEDGGSRRRQYGTPKSWYPTTSLHGITT